MQQSNHQCPYSSSCPSQSNATQPVKQPAPSKKKSSRVRKTLGTLLLAFVMFFAGGLADYLSLDSEIRALMQVKRRVQKEYYQEMTDEEFYKAVFGGLNGKLDAYSGYLTPEEFMQMYTKATGNYTGIGVAFGSTAIEDGGLKIMNVAINSPAERAGVRAGDRIVGVGADQSSIQAITSYESFATFLQSYGENQEFCMQLRTSDGNTRTVTLASEEYLEGYVTYRTNTSAYRFVNEKQVGQTQSGEPLTALDNDMAYIRLTSFNGNIVEEFGLAMSAFKRDGKKHLVLDLRDNTGGYVDMMVEIASYLGKTATKGAVASVADYGEKKEAFCIENSLYNNYFQSDSRVVVLANDYTASASESLIGYMYDYQTIDYSDICLSKNNGVAKTYGKGIMQTTYPLILTGGAIKLTTAKVFWPVSNHCIHGRGILPEDGALQVQGNADFEAELLAALGVLFGE